MKKTLLLLLGLLSACQSKPTDSVVQQDSTPVGLESFDTVSAQVPADELHDSDYGIYHYTFTVSKRLPVYSLKIQLPENKAFLYPNRQEEGEPQEIQLSEDINRSEGYFAENPEANFVFEDYNFDGFKDVAFIQIAGTANTLYDLYLFNKSTFSFVHNPELSELSSPVADSVNHEIRYHNAGGMAGGWYTAGVIRWVEQKPVVVREEEQSSSESNPEIFIREIRVRNEKGLMQVASKVQLQELEGGKEKQCLLEGDWEAFDKYPNLIFAESSSDIVRVDARNGSCDR